MISPSATLPAPGSLSGKGAVPSVSGTAGTVSAEIQGTIPGTFASLLETGITAFPATALNASPTVQGGKILPDGKVSGKLLPLGTDLPADAETIEAATIPPLAAAVVGLALPMPEAQPPQISAAGPAKAQPKTALPLGANLPIDPSATPQTLPAQQVDGAKPAAQVAHAPAVLAVQTAQQAKPGTSSARQLAGSAEPSAPAAPTIPAAQIISATSTRDALDIPRAMLATSMPASQLVSGDPVMATGLTASAANLAAPDTMIQTPLAPRDFEALIDRLAQARETAQPGAARVSLPHSEFGQVNLRFDASASSMTVTMTSQDPDFALAARTALAERAVLTPDQARNDSSNTGQSQGQSQGQPQGQTQGQMNGQARPANNNTDRNPQRDSALESEHPANDRTANQGAGNRGLFA